jgi:hypothetical protein
MKGAPMQATDELKTADSNVAELHGRAELMGLNFGERVAARRDHEGHHHGLSLTGRVI